MNVDLTQTELSDYRSLYQEPPVFDAFWSESLTLSRAAEGEIVREVIDSPLTTVTVTDLTFTAFAGQPVKAWLKKPRGATAPLETVVEFVGYGGGRGHPWENLFWPSAGYAHLMMDTRGQGSAWAIGETPDAGSDGTSQIPGFMTRGIPSPSTYYYRRVICDAVRAVETAALLLEVDANRIAVAGRSQGGGLALAAAALSGSSLLV